jgi:hypothetical protein
MRAIAILAGLLLADGAIACGYCVEDKIAAAYDHAVVVSALDRRHEVAFLSIEGGPAKGQERAIAGAVESVAGVDRGTVRVSIESGSVRKKLAAKGTRASLLKVLDDKIGASARL